MNRREQRLIYRFFEGVATEKEEKKIKEWMKASEDNERQFMRERVLYDAQLFSEQKSGAFLEREISICETVKYWKTVSAAAIVVLFIMSTYLLLEKKSDNTGVSNHAIYIPKGQYINIRLDDHTNVWLNGDTHFNYPSRFDKKHRTVCLDGEAYFEVATNKKKPFIVKTNYGDIKVTGTTFNVEAYSKYETFETSLFEGRVELYKNDKHIASLKPNEKGIMKNKELLISKIDDMSRYQWRYGLIVFNNKSLEEITRELEKNYDTRIVITNKNITKKAYTGKFRLSDGIDYALKVLQKSIDFQYQEDKENNTIYIK